MTQDTLDLYVIVGAGPDADRQDVYDLTQQLTGELDQLDDVTSVRPVPEDALPAGAKGLPAAVGTLLVKLAESAGVASLINLLASWRQRDASRTLTLQLGDSTLELTGLSGDEQQELIQWFQTQAGMRLDR